MRKTSTTDEKIRALDDKFGFGVGFSLETPECIDFYYSCMKQDMSLLDIDHYAMLNTLFGYDIGIEDARKLNSALWEKDIEVLDLTEGDASKDTVKEIASGIGLELDFSKWRMEKIEAFTYFDAN